MSNENFEHHPVFNVSFIIPVKNGGEYFKMCLNSIFSQTLKTFNVIVLDNASTDDTVQWLTELGDPRVTVYSSEVPLSIEKNWDRIKSVKREEWMMIIGHDDLLSPEYLEEMQKLTAQHPKASLYQCHFNYIDENGKVKEPCVPMSEIQTAQDFMRVTRANGGGFLMRSADYDAVGGIPVYPNLFFADFALWLKLSDLSYKATSPRCLFSYRVHPANTSATSADEKYLAGFAQFAEYIKTLKGKSAAFNLEVNNFAREIIALYCKGISHRLLRKDLPARNGLTVANVVSQFKSHADSLIDNNDFNPGHLPSVRVARFIDSNWLTRKLFLVYKRIFPKPFM